jgi:DNA repair protein RadC
MRDDADVERRSIEELLAMVAGVERAPDLVDRAGGLERLARADAFEIATHLKDLSPRARAVRPGPGARRAGPLRSAWAVAAAFELGRRAELSRALALEKLESPADVADWAAPRLAGLTHEELWLLGVDGRGYVRGARCVAKGGLHGAAVRAADPIRVALRVDASAFVLVHNHPSGDPTPSAEDVTMTAQVASAAAIVGVALLDHVVVARSGFACVPIPGRGITRTVIRDRDRDGSAR